VVGRPDLAPNLARMAADGVLFTNDVNDTVSCHGQMSAELLTGRQAAGPTLAYPTWSEYVRRATGEPASRFWMLQPVAEYRGRRWDDRHYSLHPRFGLAVGATSLTMAATFDGPRRDPAALVAAQVEPALGHSPRERADIAAFLAGLMDRHAYLPDSTRTPVIDRPLQRHEAIELQIAVHLLRHFRPRLVTLQLFGMDDAHADHGYWSYDTDFEEYLKHVQAIDELVGRLYDAVIADPYLGPTTAIVVRPDCGRDDHVNLHGQLHHSPGQRHAHVSWTTAVGPDFARGLVVTDPVNRRDLAPTLVHALSGGTALYCSGRIRTRLFRSWDHHSGDQLS
jgi:hypothetical protein